MALRPRRSPSRITSWYGAQTLAVGARPGALSEGRHAGGSSRSPGARSVDTPAVVAGFGGTPSLESVDPPRRGGRIWRGPLPDPAPASAHGDPGRLQVAADGLPADPSRRLNAPQRPAKLTEGENLLLFGGGQDVAHGGEPPRRGVPPATPQLASRGGRFSGVHWWPDLGVHRDQITYRLVSPCSPFRRPLSTQARLGA